jgi:hypothetical protein
MQFILVLACILTVLAVNVRGFVQKLPGHCCDASTSPSRSQSIAFSKHIQGNLARVTTDAYNHKTARQLSSVSFEAPDLPPLFVPALAVILLVASQGFINQLASGDQGLGAYLKDGKGVGRSSFRPLTVDDDSRAVSSDPLPWLKLPKLDFVEVAGQVDAATDKLVHDKLASMHAQVQNRIDHGDYKQAERLKKELDTLMKDAGWEYNNE